MVLSMWNVFFVSFCLLHNISLLGNHLIVNLKISFHNALRCILLEVVFHIQSEWNSIQLNSRMDRMGPKRT